MQVTVIDHPLATERLTILRDASTPNSAFRQALDGLAGMLVYEATRTLAVEQLTVTTPLGPAAGVRLASGSPATRPRSNRSPTSPSCQSRSPAGR
jgi:uracil phosphoribosyltransferase